MGPSGSGKTSLLNALALQTPASDRVRLSGSLAVNGLDVGREGSSDAEHAVAYVQQEDVFYSQLTVYETLETAARLRMGAGATRETRELAITALLRRLGLTHARDTRVGDKKTRGISGGEKKRLALACELVGESPAVVAADEPTSGLDAFQAQRVMESLRALARDERKTVICSIHQPRGSIVALFDDICLMAGGEVVYVGAMKDAASWFQSQGHPVPPGVNPAEFLIDLVSIDATDAESETRSMKRLKSLVDAWRSEGAARAAKKKTAADGSTVTNPDETAGAGALQSSVQSSVAAAGGGPGGFFSQFALLLRRSWRQVRRDRATNGVRLATSLNSALVFGSIFWRMGTKQSSIQDRLGLLQVSAINAAMAALMKTLTAFTKEKVIVNRERASGAYGMFPYLLAKLAAELPVGAFFPLAFGAVVYPMAGLHPGLGRFSKFCGLITLESFSSAAVGLAVSAVAPSTEAAVAMGPAVMVLFIVFGGYYVNAENVPRAFRWINGCSLIKWAFQGLCINEFDGLDVGSAARAQVNVMSFCYLLTLHLLEKTAPKFARIEEI
ncbi:ATP-binding cassette superfamily [Micromonas pusilla CCMP1545]|uniref:ATP-binding cassette superfamily n=2 Tax=Micromonas pusilla TaxID=38833 RepID=C1N9R6_MICPC|nr:ATP-binding cassette superfamily [Micromonas pusilla CCMP1545]EEH51115.1 ATP-binding cassette superfamily [Micromonas pusilla CCMP1545]|eukprot:XP_003064781.1 ATP-binding cassette superfamily [Micromonas pusilla CCMP1545]